jgi:SAM-dependent methyltransferase
MTRPLVPKFGGMTSELRTAGSAREGGAELTLQAQAEAWEARPLVRALYRDWYARMAKQMSSVHGPTIELGCGIGSFKEFMPGLVATDLIDSPWAEKVVDARDLPYADESVANLVMVDVIHHLPEPLKCLAEAQRVLVPGGRLVALEPFCSPLSRPLWKRFHHEPVDVSARPFADTPQSRDDPWDANTALPTLLFWRDLEDLRRRLPRLHVVTRERLAWLVYPLSGGFSGRALVPSAIARPLLRLETILPLNRVAAFRCLVTLEKR